MEQLVDRVLEGRGAELVGKESDNPEVQEFLLNVPAYMAKIASIHKAASSGNLRDLQSLLDRKRLALAQDEYGRGPLHKAILHNHIGMVRYMASNYPQALTLVDKNKRTALHYAATLPDSGVMYKSLIQSGGDPNQKDRHGNTPGIYLRRKDLLTHADLLAVGTAAQPPKSVKRNKSSVDTWERPPSLTKDKKEVTRQETIEVETTQLATLETYYHQISKEESLWARTWRRLLLTSAQNTNNAKSYLKKYLTPEIFDQIKTRSTPRYGATLLDCIKFHPQYFLIAADPHCYMTFKEVFIPAIRDHNGRQTVPSSHPDIVYQGQAKLKEDIPIVDLPSKFVTQVRARLSRNIRPFDFISLFRKEELEEVHLILTKLLSYVGPKWDMFDLETLDKEQRDELISSRNLLIPEATKISRFWPKSRAFVLSADNNIQIWINAQDHLDINVIGQYGRLFPIMKTLDEIYTKIASHVDFHYNSQVGFLTADPFRCGTAMKITFRIRLPILMLTRSELVSECEKLHLSIKCKKGFTRTEEISPDDWIELENIYTYGLTENEIAVNTATAVNELIKMEEALARAAVLAETKPKKDGK